jgi:hypothetical protein
MSTNTPKPLDYIEWDDLIEQAQKYVEFWASDEAHEDGDFDQYIAEVALTCIYGKDFWDWHNKQYDRIAGNE